MKHCRSLINLPARQNRDLHLKVFDWVGVIRRYAVALFILCFIFRGALSSAFGAERFPPPEFDSGYTMPSTTAPPPRAPWLEYLDVMVLLAALSLSAYFVLQKRSRRAIFGLMLFSLLYFGFYRHGCICAIGSIQDVTLALFNNGYAVPLTVVAFFLLPLVFTLVFGRTFCAAVCPLGAIQDIILIKPTKMRPWLEHALGIVPFLYLGAAILFAATGSAFIICQYDPFVAFFRRSGTFNMLALGAAFLAVGIFIGRPYCRFLCPYGAILSVLSRFAKWNVTLTPNDCIQCQICDVACPFGAIREPSASPSANPAPLSKARLALLLALFPILVYCGGWLGGQLGAPFSRIHPAVNLAEQVATEDARKVEAETDASKAFRQSGRPTQTLYADALHLRGQFVLGGWIMGAFAGLVLAGKLLALFLPESHNVYEPDRAACVACGRCYSYCPKELVRIKKIQQKNVIPLVPATKNCDGSA